MTAELVYKAPSPANAGLQLYGEYASDELRAAILGAGWQEPEFPAPRMPGDIPEWLETESFHQPQGSGLFGGSTDEEGEANIARLREALAPFGIELGEPRELTVQEQL